MCIVTGGASGIGLAFTKKALLAGARVLIADISPPKEKVVSSDDVTCIGL